MKKVSVSLKNGFGYSETVYSVNANLKITRIYDTGECTWQGDPYENGQREITIPVDSVALVRSGHRDGHGTYSFDVIWGKIPNQLDLPKDKALWFKRYGQHTVEPVQIQTVFDYIQAQIEDVVRDFNSKEWQSMPYRWGDQAAACFWRLHDGKLETVVGTSEHAPWINSKGELTSEYEENEKELNRIDDSIQRGDTFQGGEVIQHLKASFRVRNNPLPTMRKRFGGTWRYFDSNEVQAEWEDIRFFGENPVEPENIMIFLIPNCFVIWTK